MKQYYLFSERIFNQDINGFENIITVDEIPDGPMGSLVSNETFLIHSFFQNLEGGSENNEKTVCAVYHPFYSKNILMEEDVYWIFNFLNDNRYTIETDLSVMNEYKKNHVIDENKRLLCIFYYEQLMYKVERDVVRYRSQRRQRRQRRQTKKRR
jgi:hypothetical protein